MMALRELLHDNFIDEVLTRVVRLRVLTYNDALPMLCALSIEASLSPTGVITPNFQARAFPVQEYLPRSVFVIAFEIIFLIWTLVQLLGEFFEVWGIFKEGLVQRPGHAFQHVLSEYFANLFNALDWTRFILVILSVQARLHIITDSSRDFDSDTKTFIDTEGIVGYFVQYNLFSCLVSLDAQ